MQGFPNAFVNEPVSAVGAIDLDITGNWSLAALDKIVASSTDIVDVFIYDTSKDSDGGVWRERVSHTGLGEPKALMLIVAEGGSTDTVTIYDATDSVLTLWKAWTLTNPTSVTARDGKIVIGTSTGVVVIDLIADEVLNYDATDLARSDQLPAAFDGSTVAWLSVATSGAIVNETVNDVAITVLDGAPIDTDTGLPTPTIAGATNGGVSVIQSDGTVDDLVQTSGDDVNEVMFNVFGDLVFPNETATELDVFRAGNYSSDSTTPDDLYDETTSPTLLAAPTTTQNGIADIDGTIAIGSASGLSLVAEDRASITNGMAAHITKDYNTGWMAGDIRGAWLTNTSAVADESVKANTLTENGTVPVAVVATGAELEGYGIFSAANNLTKASDADWDVVTTGTLTASVWFNTAANAAVESYMGFANAGNTLRFIVTMLTNGKIRCIDDGATASVNTDSVNAHDDGEWHKIDFVRTSSTARALYIDGKSVASNTTDAGSLTATGTLPLAIGVDSDGSTTPATTSKLALARLTAYAPTAAQIKKAYEDEKFLFRANADALLSGSSNAVADVAYDADSDRLFVGTGDGTSVFRGLERVDYVDLAGTPTSDAIVSVSGERGAYLIGTAAESVYNEPAHNLREEALQGEGLTGFPNDIAFNAGFGYDMTGENLIVQTYHELAMVRSGSFTGEAGYIDTVGTDADVIVDIEKNGTTIYATKPRFAASANTLTAGVLKTDGTEDYVSADRITFKVTQIGSTIAGQKLRFTAKGITT